MTICRGRFKSWLFVAIFFAMVGYLVSLPKQKTDNGLIEFEIVKEY